MASPAGFIRRGNNVPQRNGPELLLPQGRVQGVFLESRKGRDYFAYFGIPFAKCPERFQPPERWEDWTGTLDATKPKPRCAQASLITKRVFGLEDCLFLNVFTPRLPEPGSCDERMSNLHKGGKGSLAVMVFIFGGGFYVGGGDLYGGKHLVDQDVVLVTFNYRLGALGFLNSGTSEARGNMGLKDQVMCLKWVQENIHHFNGDPDNVTIFGESAGAACVHYHMMSEMSKGLFHKAVMQSGNALSPWAFTKDPVEKTTELAKRLGLDCDLEDMGQIMEALKEVDSYAIAAQHPKYKEWRDSIPLIHFAPSVETGADSVSVPSFLTESPIKILKSGKLVNEVPLIMGVNMLEGAYRALPILRNPARLKAVNENWAKEAHQLLLYQAPQEDVNLEKFAVAVKDFYIGAGPITSRAQEPFIDMFSDALFIHFTKASALYHSSFQAEENPVYLYLFDYKGEFSYLNSFGIFETYGATHADELQYLMNQGIFYSDIKPGTKDDEMIEKMTGIWSEFAKTRIPRSSASADGWNPLEKGERTVKLYRIREKSEMIEEPFLKRMNFWENLLSSNL